MNLDNQPHEILLQIFFDLEPSQLNKICATNKLLQAICNDEQLWREKYYRVYGNPNKPPKSWKLAFMKRYSLVTTGTVFTVLLYHPNTPFTPEVLAVFKAATIDDVYEKLAQILNDRIPGKLYQMLSAMLGLYNNMCLGIGEQDCTINLPIRGDYVRHIEISLRDSLHIPGQTQIERFIVEPALFYS